MLKNKTNDLKHQSGAEIVLGVTLQPTKENQVLSLILITPKGEHEVTRFYGGSPANATIWAANIALDFLRRILMTI
jgi:hypothetical protein